MLVIKATHNRQTVRQFELVDPASEVQRDALIAWLIDVLPDQKAHYSGSVICELWKEEW